VTSGLLTHLGGFPLVFPDDAAGAAKKAALLAVYERMKG
jgi:hypothetical protein